ncbi:hypothetical protein [Streptomyces sp. NPDC048442]|uniref:hypothetical protein n=1 Tax=Streptomyces sp. NPDC048442 TaxID=3154823 RepID=UPI00342FAA69
MSPRKISRRRSFRARSSPTGSNAVLSVHAGRQAPAAQRPAALGLFVLCYQLGGALGPALATLLILT